MFTVRGYNTIIFDCHTVQCLYNYIFTVQYLQHYQKTIKISIFFYLIKNDAIEVSSYLSRMFWNEENKYANLFN